MYVKRFPFPSPASLCQEDIDDAAALPLDLLEDTKGRSSREHISDEAVGREIVRRFKQFLRMYSLRAAAPQPQNATPQPGVIFSEGGGLLRLEKYVQSLQRRSQKRSTWSASTTCAN